MKQSEACDQRHEGERIALTSDEMYIFFYGSISIPLTSKLYVFFTVVLGSLWPGFFFGAEWRPLTISKTKLNENPGQELV